MEHPGEYGRNKRARYSGNKRMKCLVYQTVITPDRFIIFYPFGTEVGRRNDMILLRNSGLGENRQDVLFINVMQYYIYGDSVYVIRKWIQTALDSAIDTEDQHAYN